MNQDTSSATEAFLGGHASPESREAARTRFMAELDELSAHAQHLLQVTANVSGEGIAAARERLTESLSSIGDSVRRFQDEAMDQGRRLVQRTDSYVHENPWQSIALGALLGLALGVAGMSVTRNTPAASANRNVH